jgi:hypothetical protein
MLYTLAVQLAAEKIHQALEQTKKATLALGEIHAGALSEGMKRHINLQISKLEAIHMELRHAYKAMDYEMDDLKTLAQNGEAEHE